jgi:hypothetical protein
MKFRTYWLIAGSDSGVCECESAVLLSWVIQGQNARPSGMGQVLRWESNLIFIRRRGGRKKRVGGVAAERPTPRALAHLL